MAAFDLSLKIDPHTAAAALDEDIRRVLALEGVSTLEDLGWLRPNRLSLLVPMTGHHGGSIDNYLLRLSFQSYRSAPPGAQFINPETGIYKQPQDQRHVPRLTSPECQTHVEYPYEGRQVQLICCSATFEFYEVQHSVEAHHVWLPTYTFLTTITAIRRAFTSHYQGRFSSNGR